MENELNKGTYFENRRAYVTHVREATMNKNGQMQITGLMSIGAVGQNEDRSFIVSGAAYDAFVKQGIEKKMPVYVAGYDHKRTYVNANGETETRTDSSIVRINDGRKKATSTEAATTAA